MLLERTHNVTTLDIEISGAGLGFGISAHEAGREVIKTFFTSSNAARNSPKLRRLRFRRICFSDGGTNFPTFLSLDKLHHLSLLYCNSTDTLCENLSQLKLNLRSFCNAGHHGREDGHAVLLKSLPPLQTLRLRGYYYPTTSDHERFPWPIVVSHAPSLTCLEIGEWVIRRGKSKIPPSFEAFCASASNLQQLSMAGPEIERSTWGATNGLHALLVG
jgi:hypothetical protein